jgi:acyl carrier protein
MKSDNDILKEIIQIIEKYAFDKSKLQNAGAKSNIIADLKINSARIVDIILDIEEKYDIEIADDDIPKMITVEDAVNIIKKEIQN